MIHETTDLIPHMKADQMAAIYEDAIPKIFAAIHEIKNQTARIREAFAGDRGWSFELKIETRTGCTEEQSIRREFKRDAWCGLIDKLGIRKYMPNKKRDELDRILRGGTRWSCDTDEIDKFPDITPDNMYSVLSAYICNIDEFMIESVKEQFDFWCGRRWNDDYKTNRERYRISRKIIATWMVESNWGRGGFRVKYEREKYISGLDNIFHYLDGQGFPEAHRGDLASAVEMSNGAGQSKYFKFRCFKNGNIHLNCLRPDLLEAFNDIACDKAIPSQVAITRKTP